MTSAERNHTTFMFTDIEDSTRLWEEHDRAMEAVMSRHDEIFHGAVRECGGKVFKHTGDGLAAAFTDVQQAACAALQAQKRLAASDWGTVGELRSRIGIHSGLAQQRSGEFFGRDVNRCARIMDAAHGGQVLLSGTTVALLEATRGDRWDIRELGMHQLKDLSTPEAVFQLCDPALPSRFPPLRSVDRIRRQLPPLAELFVGRQMEVRRLGGMLREGRLITLTGPGGVGKTQLAIAAAMDHMRLFQDGAWFCRLGSAQTVEDIAQLIEATMELHASRGENSLERLSSGLATRRALLILDGAEHVLEAAASVATELLGACGNVVILCTSREVLRARGEQVLGVGPLALPALDEDDLQAARRSAAVALFERRARLAHSEFALGEGNLSAILSICHQVDGLPLAVELAAAQMAAFDPRDLAQRIGRRLELIDDRDKTLATLIDLSCSGLSEAERTLFRRLAVFAGGFSLTLAERVCTGGDVAVDDIVPGLSDLVDKSVLSIERTDEGNRYRMLGVFRHYILQRLPAGEGVDVQRQRHLEAYLEFANAAREGLSTQFEVDWVRRLNREFNNLRAAVAWALESGQVDRAMELVHCTDGYARDRFRREVESWAEQALAASRGDEPHRFAALAVRATAAARGDDIAGSMRLAEEALDCARQSTVADTFIANRVVAIAGILTGDRERASEVSYAAIERARERGAALEVARFTAFVAHGFLLASDNEDAGDMARQALEQARALRNPSLLAWCLYVCGLLEEDESALGLLEESIEFADMVDNQYVAGLALQASMWKLQSAGDSTLVAACLRVIRHWYRVANWAAMAIALRLCAQCMAGIDDDLVAVLDGWLRRQEQRVAFSAGLSESYDQAIARVEKSLGKAEFQMSVHRGAAMDPTQVVNYCTRALESWVARSSG